MAAPPKKRATYDDVPNAPKDVIAQVIDGDLVLMPRPAILHKLAVSALNEELGAPFQRGRGWLLL